MVYPAHFEVRRVSRDGTFRWLSATISLSHVLAEELVGFEELTTDIWAVYFGPLCLGALDVARGQVSGTRDFYPPKLPCPDHETR
jgi:hypothetical protein